VLAGELTKRHLIDSVVVALPRGGVPVGVEIAKALKAPLDLVLVRKIGVQPQPPDGLRGRHAHGLVEHQPAVHGIAPSRCCQTLSKPTPLLPSTIPWGRRCQLDVR
jgi:hypothetical protein